MFDLKILGKRSEGETVGSGDEIRLFLAFLVSVRLSFSSKDTIGCGGRLHPVV